MKLRVGGEVVLKASQHSQEAGSGVSTLECAKRGVLLVLGTRDSGVCTEGLAYQGVSCSKAGGQAVILVADPISK
jgi:hypothetical protein